ncbi:MAG: hypothetical protein F9K19_25125 [Rhizobiaceae bacterium]|nr:MAG: hypothetical protein F9K19_25125 [Rhizobiaceae bacterium]CAG1015741.1 hypothetical protein RHIZO_05141 [Rhizobiaceae bacterium]
MAEVTSELMYGLLKRIHERMDRLEHGQDEMKQEVVAVRLQGMAVQTNINNIYGVTARIDQRLDRIERRLDLRELGETQKPYEPQ